MTLSEKILYCRKKAGLSQEALAERLGVSRQAISKWETGEATPEVTKLSALAKVFGVTTDWLLSEEEPTDSPAEKAVPPRAKVNNAIDILPKELVNLIKRYGWIFGVYLALIGAGIAFMGILAKVTVKSMFTGFDSMGFYGFDGLVKNNPVNIMAAAFIIVGVALIAGGTVLAIYLKSRDGKKKK